MKRFDFSRLRLTKIAARPSKLSRHESALKIDSGSVNGFINSLPDVLKAKDLKSLIAKLYEAYTGNKPIIWMFGAHLIKVGLSPVMCEIIRSGAAQQISTNNAGLIHDLELAFFGATSEDVDSTLPDGSFGMCRETAQLYNAVAELSHERHIGLGEAAGAYINDRQAEFRKHSVFAVAHEMKIPATVHVAIGTDIVNLHPDFDGAKVGEGSQIDFAIFCQKVLELCDGGVALNFGSAVILPEVFLKALSVARNIDSDFSRFTTANFDMIRHYRPSNNLIRRPRLLGATSFDFSGHHEIMLPLLWAGLRDKLPIARIVEE